jgi:drug/metabolite transporter (DMT)-like permease
MKEPLKPKHIVGALPIIAGLIWSVMFPKTSDILRPDFVASVAIGIGLIVPGVLILPSRKARRLTIVLSTLLLWSFLLNLVLICQVKAMTSAMHSIIKTPEVSRVR